MKKMKKIALLLVIAVAIQLLPSSVVMSSEARDQDVKVTHTKSGGTIYEYTMSVKYEVPKFQFQDVKVMHTKSCGTIYEYTFEAKDVVLTSDPHWIKLD